MHSAVAVAAKVIYPSSHCLASHRLDSLGFGKFKIQLIIIIIPRLPRIFNFDCGRSPIIFLFLLINPIRVVVDLQQHLISSAVKYIPQLNSPEELSFCCSSNVLLVIWKSASSGVPFTVFPPLLPAAAADDPELPCSDLWCPSAELLFIISGEQQSLAAELDRSEPLSEGIMSMLMCRRSCA